MRVYIGSMTRIGHRAVDRWQLRRCLLLASNRDRVHSFLPTSDIYRPVLSSPHHHPSPNHRRLRSQTSSVRRPAEFDACLHLILSNVESGPTA